MIDIRRPLKKFIPHLLKARDDNLNEADTVQRLVLFFEEVLGYDPLAEITRESQIKDKYVDLAIKLDGAVRLLVEAKSAATILRDRHIEQAERYAAEGNHPWVLLTNGVQWSLYHLTFDEGIDYERVFDIDLALAAHDRAAELLGLLHRSSLIKGELEAYLRHRQALDPESLGRALFSFDTLRLIRRELRRREGLLLDVEDVAAAIRELFSTEIRERMGVIRIQRKRRPSVKKVIAASDAPPESAGPTTEADEKKSEAKQ